jgi:cytochrome c oxidase subunit II
MQSFAFQITILVLLILTGCFVGVLINTSHKVPLGQVATPAYRLRAKSFWLLVAVGLGVALLTLNPWPHDALAGEATRHIDVQARQWAWLLSDTEAQVGEVIEFRVSSEDVNHGFGLYGPDHRLISQIQAMPGFVNTVRHRFEQPGSYEILCLEYCGVAHHAMAAAIHVRSVGAN